MANKTHAIWFDSLLQDKIINYKKTGLSIREIESQSGINRGLILSFLSLHGYSNATYHRDAKLYNMGYIYNLKQRVMMHKYLKNHPEGNLLSIIECKCTSTYTCYPCQLNQLREKYGIDNTETAIIKSTHPSSKIISSNEDRTTFEATEWTHHFCGQR